MISFNSKFNSKADNIGFFIHKELKSKQNKIPSKEIGSKVDFFLKKISKNNKSEIISFDLSQKQKCFLIVIKKKLDPYEINNLGAALKNNIKSNKNIKNINILSNNVSEEIITEFAYGFELKSYNFDKYKSKKNNISQNIEFTVKNLNFLKQKYKIFFFIK